MIKSYIDELRDEGIAIGKAKEKTDTGKDMVLTLDCQNMLPIQVFA
jgi:hypothetical protein